MFTKIWWVHTVFTKKEEKKEWRKVIGFLTPSLEGSGSGAEGASLTHPCSVYLDPGALEAVHHSGLASGHGCPHSCHLADGRPLAPDH